VELLLLAPVAPVAAVVVGPRGARDVGAFAFGGEPAAVVDGAGRGALADLVGVRALDGLVCAITFFPARRPAASYSWPS
jgi:hypothetical protein